MKIKVKYPSGKTFDVVGTFKGYWPRQASVAIVILKPFREPGGKYLNRGRLMLCDPRGVLIREDGGIIYHPREEGLDLPVLVREWLNKHPEWGGREDGVAYSYRAGGAIAE